MSKTIEISEQEKRDLMRIQGYFVEHSRTLLEHLAYAVLRDIIKKYNEAPSAQSGKPEKPTEKIEGGQPDTLAIKCPRCGYPHTRPDKSRESGYWCLSCGHIFSLEGTIKESIADKIKATKKKQKEKCLLCGGELIGEFCTKCHFVIIKIADIKDGKNIATDQQVELPKFKFGDYVRHLPTNKVFCVWDELWGDVIDTNGKTFALLDCIKWGPQKGERVIGIADSNKTAIIGCYNGFVSYHGVRNTMFIVGLHMVPSIIPFLSMEQYDKIVKGEDK